MSSLLKEAQKKTVNICKELDQYLEVLMAMQHFGNKYFEGEYDGKPEFFEGLSKMRQAVYQKHCMTVSRLFSLSGIGGKGAEDYAKERFFKVFGGNYEIMSFLQDNGRIPGWYKSSDEKAFREEIENTMTLMSREDVER